MSREVERALAAARERAVEYVRCGCGRATHHPELPNCSKCRDEERFRAHALRDSGVDARHRNLTRFEDLLVDLPDGYTRTAYIATLESLRAFLNAPRATILALIGKRGTGKTQMAATAVMEAIARNLAARIVTTVSLLGALKDRYSTESGGDSTWLTEWSAPWLLVIDEFARRLATDWAATMLEQLIDQRYAANRKTVIIANCTPEEWEQLAGPSTIDRMNEGGGALVCNWASFRTEATTDAR